MPDTEVHWKKSVIFSDANPRTTSTFTERTDITNDTRKLHFKSETRCSCYAYKHHGRSQHCHHHPDVGNVLFYSTLACHSSKTFSSGPAFPCFSGVRHSIHFSLGHRLMEMDCPPHHRNIGVLELYTGILSIQSL